MDTFQNHYNLHLLGQELHLIPLKALFWKDQEILVVSDLHFGKAGHFRKAGFAVPSELHQADFLVLDQLIETYSPRSLIFLGDLFHSEINNQWDDLVGWISKNKSLKIHLVKGNHDILPDHFYKHDNIIVHEDAYCLEPFIFTHKPIEGKEQDLYNISGHIHPAVNLKGKARQSLKLPCFYFGKNNGLMPAFGSFTGTSLLSICKEDLVYVITGKSVLSAHNLVIS